MSDVVLIDAPFRLGEGGGGDQYAIGLLHGLSRLDGDAREEYVVVGPAQAPDWLRAYCDGNDRFRFVSRESSRPGRLEAAKQLLGPLRGPAGRAVRRISGKPEMRAPRDPASDGFWESFNADVLHQLDPLAYATTGMPTVLTVHDVQHRHLPEFFSQEVLAWREAVYPAVFERSAALIAVSEAVKDDVVREYGIPPGKIYAIPSAAPTEAYLPPSPASLAALRRRLRLPDRFMLCPALTYRHKNHVRLLEAIALLRDRDGVRRELVCTGRQALFWADVARRVRELGLDGQVRFLGFVPVEDLRALYHLAQFLVFPSLFEGTGLPVLEAFREGLPVTCSGIPALREYGGDAPLFFDPLSVEDIALAIRRVGEDEGLRGELRERGRRRAQRYRWIDSAQAYRAVYRKTAGGALSPEDQAALALALGHESRGPQSPPRPAAPGSPDP